jgi:hypothetical protein
MGDRVKRGNLCGAHQFRLFFAYSKQPLRTCQLRFSSTGSAGILPAFFVLRGKNQNRRQDPSATKPAYSEYPGPFGGAGSGPGIGPGSGSGGGKFGSSVPGVSGVGGVVTGSSGRGPGSTGCSGPGCRAASSSSKAPTRISSGLRMAILRKFHGECESKATPQQSGEYPTAPTGYRHWRQAAAPLLARNHSVQ